jgi:hypothetical protein
MSLFCSPLSSSYVQDDCGSPGGVISIAIVDRSITPTLEERGSSAYWQGLVSSGMANLLTNIRGEYLGAEVEEADGFALDAIQIVGVKHTAQTEFMGLKENSGINPVIRDHKLALFLYSGHMLWVNSPVISSFKMVIPKGVQSGAYWVGTHVWQDEQAPTGPDPLDEIVIIPPPVIVPPNPIWLWHSGQFVLWNSGLTVDLE